MKNFLMACLIGIVFSMYIFPFEFHALPGINTKMMLAVVGLVLFILNLIAKRTSDIGKDMFGVTVFAMLFSLVSYFSVVYNNTTDMAYATYFVSMWVWVGAAYCIIELIRKVHGHVSLQLIFHYWACVCVVQLCIALVVDTVPEFQNFVDTYISQNEAFLHKTKRLYGIGASFDSAGIRFSCGLIGLGYLITHKPSQFWLWVYWIIFIIIIIVGNIMSRTTIVGVLMSMLYMVISRFSLSSGVRVRQIKRALVWIAGAIAIIVVITHYYNKSYDFRQDVRYAFEGFFNYVETGEWETSSTNRLKAMVVLPDNIQTWIIGDGWFADPNDPDSYYMYTDVGYLRLIYYCGLIGFISFLFMFLYIVNRLSQKWPSYRRLFVLLLILQLIVWIKISTDIFQFFVLLLLLPHTGNITTENIFDDYDTEKDPLLLA